MSNLLNEIVLLSREYGGSRDWVIGGGGNTSIKDDRWMWVKASGSALAAIEPEQFVKMDRGKLDAIWQVEYPADREEREERAKTDLFAARAPGEDGKRPSVEALMHALFPSRIVYHTHPTIVNALTCALYGEFQAQRIFGDDLLWIPMINPGYVLAKRVYDERRLFIEEHGREPRFILLQNHGLVVHGETPNDIRRDHGEIVDAIARAAGGAPPESEPREPSSALKRAAERIRESDTHGALYLWPHADALLDPFIGHRATLLPVSGSLTPDHIVYAGHVPAWVEEPEQADQVFAQYEKREGVPPKTVVVRGEGILGVGTSAAAAENACRLFVDAGRVAHLAEAFGGVQFMPPDQVEFIRNWEVEKYRQEVSS